MIQKQFIYGSDSLKPTIYKWVSTVAASALLLTAALPAPVAQATNSSIQKNLTKKSYAKRTLVIQSSNDYTYQEIQQLKGTIIQQIPDLHTMVVQFKTDEAMKKAIDWFSQDARFERLSLSPLYETSGQTDEKASLQYTHQLFQTKKLVQQTKKKKIKVAVIDTGVDANHVELKGQVKKALNIANPMKAQVKKSHGTHVAGIIAAKMNNGIGGYGVNPNAEILSYDVFNGSEYAADYDVAKAILQAIKDGAKVINLSLGNELYSPLVDQAVQKAHAKGVAVFAASGNDDTDRPDYPASLENVISVGSVNAKKKRSDFSNYGASLDLMAPGEDIYSTSYDATRGSTFETMSGTSMASPAAAGIASSLLINHAYSPEQLAYVLEKTAKDLGTKGYDLKYGYGFIQPLAAQNFKGKIPTFTSKKWTNATILKDATVIKGTQTKKGTLKQPNETKWYQVPVKKGELIQATASSNNVTDLKLVLKTFGTKVQTKTIQDTGAGEKEAGFVQAKEDGTVAIGVKNVYGHANTPYALDILKQSSKPKDEASIEKPMALKSTNTKVYGLYMNETADGVDQDAFHIKATKDELVQVQTSALPGVDLSIEVYKKQDLLNEESSAPLVSINKNGIGKAEYASFPATTGEEYEVIVSNSSNSEAMPEEDVLNQLKEGVVSPKASLLPYQLTLSSRTMPADEDSIIFNPETSQKIDRTNPTKVYTLEQLFKKKGRPFDVVNGVEGFLQGSTDLDGYYFKTTTSGFYEFNTAVAHAAEQPSVTIYEVQNDPKTGMRSEEFLASNSTEDGIMKKKAIASLQANTTYLVEVGVGSVGSIPKNGYRVTAKKLQSNIVDKYEQNNVPEQAKTIRVNQKVTANFARPNDVDFYYFKAPKDGIYQMKMDLSPFDDTKYSKEWHNLYTKSITVYEDKNHNHKMDGNDLSASKPVGNDLNGEPISGSIEAKKGDTFFVLAQPTAFLTTDLFSIYPYELKIQQGVTKDEDAKNKVKNNRPSHPISLTKKSASVYEKTGYLNPGHLQGDEDWYAFKNKTTKKVRLVLSGAADFDPVITLYANGKKLKTFDAYGVGDEEIGSYTFKKNTTYAIKVKDRQGNAFADPYKLRLTLQK